MKVYSSQNLQHSSILRNINDSISFAHSFSGCDTSSSFHGQEKMKTASLLNKYDHLQNVVSVFNNSKSTHDEVAASGEQFILAFYKAPTTETNLDNHHRFLSFNKSVSHSNHAVLLSGLPPTSAAAHPHSYRAYHQIQTWREAKTPRILGLENKQTVCHLHTQLSHQRQPSS